MFVRTGRVLIIQWQVAPVNAKISCSLLNRTFPQTSFNLWSLNDKPSQKYFRRKARSWLFLAVSEIWFQYVPWNWDSPLWGVYILHLCSSCKFHLDPKNYNFAICRKDLCKSLIGFRLATVLHTVLLIYECANKCVPRSANLGDCTTCSSAVVIIPQVCSDCAIFEPA